MLECVCVPQTQPGQVGVCLNVCACMLGFIQNLEFWKGKNSKFRVAVEVVCVHVITRGSLGACSLRFF